MRGPYREHGTLERYLAWCGWDTAAEEVTALKDRIVALERELEFHKTELVDTRKRLGEMELVWEQDGRNHERVLNEAHAAIRWLMARFHPYVNVPIEHTPAIRRARSQ